MKKVLWVGDGTVPTGFGRVNHALIERLKNKYEIHHLALNYRGAPHNYDWKIYPALIGGDLYGRPMLEMFIRDNYWDIVFLFNDVPIVNEYLGIIEKYRKNVGKVVVYFPVDSSLIQPQFFSSFDVADKVFVMSEFGRKEAARSLYYALGDVPELEVLYHGVDSSQFRKIEREKAREKLFNGQFGPETVLFLNANRNQPRKRIDLTLAGFAEFVKEEKLLPKDVSLFLHMGTVDQGVDILHLANYYGITSYLVFYHISKGHPMVPQETYELILNATDIGVNTSVGEGFGLVSVEHGFLGKPQIVPNNSVLPELWGDDAYYIETPVDYWSQYFTTLFKSGTPETVKEAMKQAYYDFVSGKAKVGEHRFRNNPKFDWDVIAEKVSHAFDS